MVWQLVCKSVFECATFDLEKKHRNWKTACQSTYHGFQFSVTMFQDLKKSMLNIIKHLKRCVYIYKYHIICVYNCIYHIMCAYNCIYHNLDHSQLSSVWYNWSVYTTSSKAVFLADTVHKVVPVVPPVDPCWSVLTRATLDPPGHLRKELLISSAGDIWRAASNILLGTGIIILGCCYTTMYSCKMMKITDYLYNLVYTQHSGEQVCGQKGTNSKVRIELMNRTQKGLRFNI